MRWMVAGAGLAIIAAALAWQVGAQARDGAEPFVDRPAAASTGFVPLHTPGPASTAKVVTPANAAPTAVELPARPAAVAIDDTPADTALLLRTVSLQAGRRGEAYRPLLLVRRAMPANAVRLTGQLPPGLALGDDGSLRGVPTQTGLFPFELEVVDGASAQVLAHQRYALRVLVPASARRATAAASRPADAKPTFKTITEADSAAYVDVNKAVPASYLLTSIAAWVPTEESAKPGSDAASAVVPPPSDADAAADANAPVTAVEAARLPTVDQLREELTPLLDIEFPTRPLFVQALQASHCNYYRAHVKELAGRTAVDTTCPPPGPAAAASGPASRNPGDPMTLGQFYEALLPPRLEKDVIGAALKLHPLEDAMPLLLAGDGCGCHVPVKDDENVYGMFPYWLATKEVQAVDFSLFSHNGYMGAVLQDDGSLLMAGGSTSRSVSFARVAALHETAVDLVVYRRDWADFLGRDDLDRLAERAATNAVQEAELRFDDATSRWMQPLLMPGWRTRGRVFAGLTIFFDDASVAPGQRALFKHFYQVFTQKLIAAMQRDGQSYHLNFVVPDAELGDEDGAYGFTQLAEYMELAQPKPRDKNVDQATRNLYKGSTDISVFYLVTLGAPTTESRLELRSKVDRTNALHGHRRVAFLQGVVPMLFGARSSKGQPMSDVHSQVINSDLAYMRWNYGGAGFWPSPVWAPGVDDPLHEVLVSNYRPPPRFYTAVCDLACPNRVVLRLLFQLALLVELVGVVAYGWSCRTRGADGRGLLALLLGAFATVAVASVVFACDPALDYLRTSSWLLVALIVLLGLWGLYKTLRPTMDPP